MLSRRGAVTGIDIGHQAIKLVRLENGGPAAAASFSLALSLGRSEFRGRARLSGTASQEGL